MLIIIAALVAVGLFLAVRQMYRWGVAPLEARQDKKTNGDFRYRIADFAILFIWLAMACALPSFLRVERSGLVIVSFFVGGIFSLLWRDAVGKLNGAKIYDGKWRIVLLNALMAHFCASLLFVMAGLVAAIAAHDGPPYPVTLGCLIIMLVSLVTTAATRMSLRKRPSDATNADGTQSIGRF